MSEETCFVSEGPFLEAYLFINLRTRLGLCTDLGRVCLFDRFPEVCLFLRLWRENILLPLNKHQGTSIYWLYSSRIFCICLFFCLVVHWINEQLYRASWILYYARYFFFGFRCLYKCTGGVDCFILNLCMSSNHLKPVCGEREREREAWWWWCGERVSLFARRCCEEERWRKLIGQSLLVRRHYYRK